MVAMDLGFTPTFTGPVHVRHLLAAELVSGGDVFAWYRYAHVRHAVRVHGDGRLVLEDGRMCESPSGVLAAMGANHWNGWILLRRISDGRTLGHLREELQVRQARSAHLHAEIANLQEMW
jgi:RAMA domain-containing protein